MEFLYAINWAALDRMEPAQRMAALARINTDIRSVTGAERVRMVHRAIAQHGSQAAAARHLGMKKVRTNQLAKEEPIMVRVFECDEPAELYHERPGSENPQPCYVELDLRERTLHAAPNAADGIPAEVFYGHVRRYPIPLLTAEAANRLLTQIRPLAERICSDWDEVWDGNNFRAVLGEDARAAEAAILRLVGDPRDWEHHWDPADLVDVWPLDAAVLGDEADQYDITATTTDARLDEIEEEICASLAEVGPSRVAVVPGLTEYLQDLRDERLEDLQE